MKKILTLFLIHICIMAVGDNLLFSAQAKNVCDSNRYFGAMFDPGPLPDIERDQEVELGFQWLKDAGVKFVRKTYRWQYLEPEPNSLNPEIMEMEDRYVKLAATNDISILACIQSVPKWASSFPDKTDYETYIPADWDTYVNFVRKLVRRYKWHIRHWQVGNETNLGSLKSVEGQSGIVTVPLYIKLCRKTYETIKAEQPEAVVVMGGLSEWEGMPYLKALFEQGVTDYVDVIGYHPYASTVEQTISKIDAVLALMGEFDVKEPLWIDEIHWTVLTWPNIHTNCMVANESIRASNLGQLYRQLRNKIDKVFWYRTGSHYPDDNEGAALLRYAGHSNFRPTEAYYTYRRQGNPCAFELCSSIDAMAFSGSQKLENRDLWATNKPLLITMPKSSTPGDSWGYIRTGCLLNSLGHSWEFKTSVRPISHRDYYTSVSIQKAEFDSSTQIKEEGTKAQILFTTDAENNKSVSLVRYDEKGKKSYFNEKGWQDTKTSLCVWRFAWPTDILITCDSSKTIYKISLFNNLQKVFEVAIPFNELRYGKLDSFVAIGGLNSRLQMPAVVIDKASVQIK
jgi:hypothetical protein